MKKMHNNLETLETTTNSLTNKKQVSLDQQKDHQASATSTQSSSYTVEDNSMSHGI